MKLLLFLSFGLIQASYAQSGNTIYIRQIGWTIILPKDFKVKKNANDSSGNTPDSSGKIFLITADKNSVNSFTAINHMSPGITSDNWQQADSAEQQSLLKSFGTSLNAKPQNNLSGVTNIDGIVFKENQSEFVTRYNATIHFIFFSAFYKNHYLLITTYFTDSKAKDEIINMINSSKFDK
jgi:hypothetical protein